MNDDSQNPRPRTTKLVEAMLDERKEMLILLWDLSKLEPFKATDTLRNTLEKYLGVLVDYIAAGHFGLYERIAERTERRKPVVETAREIYPRIAASTDVAVEFSEKYEDADDATLESSLAMDLSTLAEEVTSRIELEDRLIIAMLGAEFQIPDAAQRRAS
jgi:regulator of sigma D